MSLLNTLSFILFQSLLLKSNTEDAISPPCTLNDFNAEISKCSNNQRNIFFSIKSNCDPFAKGAALLPPSKIGIPCLSCSKGEYMEYNFISNQIECKQCPENTFSPGGSISINGTYRDWLSDDVLLPFKNKCFIIIGKSESDNCKGWSPSITGDFLKTNNGYNAESYSYLATLSLKIEIVKKGKIKFTYKKETIIENSLRIGMFRFYINYLVEIEDFDTNKGHWKDVSYDLVPGIYTFLWSYGKYVSSSSSESISMKIKDIEITGTDTSLIKCNECIGGTSKIASDHCSYCIKGEYFDNVDKTCKKCPSGTSSNYKSIGIESCIKESECTESSYAKIISSQCNSKTNKQKVHYELIQSNCNEKNINAVKDIEIDCMQCPKGQYVKMIDETYSKCEYCPEGTFSSEVNDVCSFCEGIVSNILYYIPDKSSRIIQNIEIVNMKGKMIIKYFYINPKEISNISLTIDFIPYSGILLSEQTVITLSVGKHVIQIESSNIYIEMITITNTYNGGGYQCLPCSSGFLIKENDKYICKNCGNGMQLNDNNQCEVCPKGYYKFSNEHSVKCLKCPKFTTPNLEKNRCIPFDITTNNEYKLKFLVGDYLKYQSNICEMTNNLCYDNFYGPIREKGTFNFYFISFNQVGLFNTNDFSYKFKEKNEASFIYLVEPNDNKTNEILGTKIVTSLGKEIQYIKMVSTKNKKGIIIKYINGDLCEDNKTKISSILFLNCSKEANEYSYYNPPKFLSKNNCIYYFEWSSRAGCPLCLESTTEKIKFKCKNFQRFIINTEGAQCVIEKTDGMNENDITKEIYESDLLIDNIDNIGVIYNISIEETDFMVKPQKNETYVEIRRYSEVCYLYDDFDMEIFVLIIIIMVPVLYIVVLILFIYFWCKYRKISGEYQRLVEEPIPIPSVSNNVSNAPGYNTNPPNVLGLNNSSKEDNKEKNDEGGE